MDVSEADGNNIRGFLESLPDKYFSVLDKAFSNTDEKIFYGDQYLLLFHFKALMEAERDRRAEESYKEDDYFGKK